MFSLANKSAQSKKRTAEASLDEPTKRRKIAVEKTVGIVEKEESQVISVLNFPTLLDTEGRSIMEKGYTPKSQQQEDLSMEFHTAYLDFLDKVKKIALKNKKYLK